MKKIIAYCIIFFSCSYVYSQGELDTQNKIFYRNESTVAGLLNSTGFGINYRYAKRIDAFRKTTYEGGLAFIKHPKEVKISTNTYPTSRSYVYGKINQFYALRGGIGFQKELFQKFDKGGISIRYFYNAGLSVGMLKPIYYQVEYYSAYPNPSSQVKIEKFDPGQHTSATVIDGKASFFKGFNEIKVIPGIYGKLGATFEFGNLDQVYHAIETGIIIDAFPKKIQIMATENNNRIFFSLFLSYRFGKIINAQFKDNKSTKLDKIIDSDK
jgi:hypothetical protein